MAKRTDSGRRTPDSQPSTTAAKVPAAQPQKADAKPQAAQPPKADAKSQVAQPQAAQPPKADAKSQVAQPQAAQPPKADAKPQGAQPQAAQPPKAEAKPQAAQPLKAEAKPQAAQPQKSDVAPKSNDAAIEELGASLPAQALDLKTQATKPVGEFSTGLGSACQLKLDAFQPQKTPSGYVTPYKMTVVYEDKTGYFGDSKLVQAWSQFKDAEGAVAATLDDLMLERQNNGKYVGTALVTQKAPGPVGLSEAAFAFSAQGKWDSNEGRNYRLTL